jgi:hypothetical protein
MSAYPNGPLGRRRGPRAQLKAATKAWLDQMPPEDLQELAAAAFGFEHPGLVGLGEGPSPLAHWLDPAYPEGTPSKAKIQAKTLERYGALCAGQTIGGAALSPTATNPAGTKPPGGGGEWVATPANVVVPSRPRRKAPGNASSWCVGEVHGRAGNRFVKPLVHWRKGRLGVPLAGSHPGELRVN